MEKNLEENKAKYNSELKIKDELLTEANRKLEEVIYTANKKLEKGILYICMQY